MRRNEKGFIAIDLVIVVALTAIIAIGAGMTTMQIIDSSRLTGDWTTTIRQAQNLGYRLSQDALMAQTITISDDPETADVEFIIAYWKDWETGDTHDIRYVWFDSVDSLKKLKRIHVTKDKDGVEIDNETTLVADNIYTASLSWQDGMWTLTVEVRSGTKSATREYEITKRLQIV